MDKNVTLLTRKEASTLISGVASLVFVTKPKDGDTALSQALTTLLQNYGVELPTKCTGDAHSNPNIDHCGVCMPGWGIVEKPVKRSEEHTSELQSH